MSCHEKKKKKNIVYFIIVSWSSPFDQPVAESATLAVLELMEKASWWGKDESLRWGWGVKMNPYPYSADKDA